VMQCSPTCMISTLLSLFTALNCICFTRWNFFLYSRCYHYQPKHQMLDLRYRGPVLF
jgi:hypothetical protein